MQGARRPPDAVGLSLVDELAERTMRTMRSGRRIGLVVGCLARGEQRLVGHGQVRTGTKDRPDGATIFEIGSVTKVFTGLLLADLAHEGIVGLDAPLASYLPAWVRVPTRGGRQITLGDLASHAAGLPRNPSGTLRRWRGDRSMSCTPALPGPGCGADRASASGTPTWAPACWARRWPARARSPTRPWSASASAGRWGWLTP
jgi:CubicO group peptidase (beta-lactamase class C family)